MWKMWKEKSEKHWNWELFKIAADSFFRCTGDKLTPFSTAPGGSGIFFSDRGVACKLHRRGLGCCVKNPLIFGAHDRVTTGHRVCGNEADTVSLRCRTKLHLKMRCYCATQVILWICLGKLSMAPVHSLVYLVEWGIGLANPGLRVGKLVIVCWIEK